MSSISTKTGDQGKTGLANGKRMSKDELVFEVIGTLDELNAWIGYCLVELPEAHSSRGLLDFIQEQLFVVGAEVAQSTKVTLDETLLNRLETASDELQNEMGDIWQSKFLLPGGVESAARVDITRTICRRAERLLVRYHQETSLSPIVLKTINRLSDYLYLLRCYLNWKSEYKEEHFLAKKK